MEEIMYEFGGYSDDHDFEWPAVEEFSDGSDGNIMSSEVFSVVVDTCSNLQEEDQKKNIISSHLLYPKLLLTYIDCHKVGAPPEIVNMLDNIAQENDLHRRSSSSSTALNQPITDDSELDDFMATYCDVLAQLKLDLGRSFNEATTFLNDIQTQLTNLSTTTNISARVEDIGTGEKGWSDDNNPSLSCEFESAIEQIKKEEGVEAEEGDTMGDEVNNNGQQNSSSDELCRSGSEIKDKLMEKYSGYITSLKHDFCKKNYNKGKLPKEATQILLNWWTTHYNWPYPTEGEKVSLAESTSLDPKQINNWFINQRKRHWKLPSQNMQFPAMETIYGRHFSQ